MRRGTLKGRGMRTVRDGIRFGGAEVSIGSTGKEFDLVFIFSI